MTKKRFLCVMDAIEKLDPQWDNTLALLGELTGRGHEVWTADIPDLWAKKNILGVRGQRFGQSSEKSSLPIDRFDLVLIRKEPPFDNAYLELTLLLETAAKKIPMVNHPRGLRNNNEKLSILNFPKWIPETIVSASAEQILLFQNKLRAPIIVKPLDQKGGDGIFLIRSQGPASLRKLANAAQNGKKVLMAQRFIEGKKIEKRIFILNGKILTLYEKRPKGREFRGNLGLGATWHPSPATSKEKQLVREMGPWLLKEGLYCVGIDVMNEKLLEINVTCPAGVTEAKFLGLRPDPLAQWASFLEDFPRRSARLKN